MARAIGKIRKRYTPLNLAYSRSVSGALNQNYDANYQTYDPDRGLVPLEILFTVSATDTKRIINPGVINSRLTDIRWYENSIAEANNILDSNTRYVIDRDSATDNRGKITVKKNTPLEGVVLIFTAKYTDPRDGKVVNVNASIPLGVTVSTDEPLRVKTGYPFGQVVDPTEQRDHVEIDNTLFMGDHEYEGAIYWWQKKVGSDHVTINEGENGITGTFSGKLKAPCPAVGKRMDIRCIADALPSLTGINLISKSMISDDWNAIKAGISTPGEDADGKYYAINQSELYAAFNKGTEDLFFGKIKYKTNQQYRLSVNWKMQSKQDSSGLYIIFDYTDGTSDRVIILGSSTSKIMNALTSPPGKTVQKIRSSYGTNSYKTNIYDLQLVEYYGADNLVSGGAYARIPASGVATGNESTVFYINKEMAAKLTPGTKVTLSVESVNILAGKASGLSFNIYDGVNQSTGEVLPLSSLKVTRTIKSNPSSTSSPYINIYGGIFNNMIGNAIELRGVMLVIGETAYKYSPAEGEFLPAIPDGAPRPNNPSNRAITTDHVLSTQYPKCDLEVVAPAEILDDTRLIEAGVVMHSNRGDVVKPELYWGFPWKDKTGAIFARGSKVFIKEEQFEDDMFDYSVEAVEGLDEAKWAANLNGIDQYLGNSNPDNLLPWGIGRRTHVVEFIVNEFAGGDTSAPLFVLAGSYNNFTYGFGISVMPSSHQHRLQYRPGTKTGVAMPGGAAASPHVGSQEIVPGVLYRVECVVEEDGSFSASVNGKKEVLTDFGGAIYSSNVFRMGMYSSLYSSIKILRYETFNTDKSVYHMWDFQPTNGDRNNMLKNKNINGSVKGTSNLTPYNAPNALTDIDPENGFFVTI